MWPKFDDYVEGSGGSLKCPACQGYYLHHIMIEVFEREDRVADGLYFAIAAGELTSGTELIGNPSRDRGGVCIHFECENCPSTSVLTIAQHKGNTWLDLKLTSENLGHLDRFPYSE